MRAHLVCGPSRTKTATFLLVVALGALLGCKAEVKPTASPVQGKKPVSPIMEIPPDTIGIYADANHQTALGKLTKDKTNTRTWKWIENAFTDTSSQALSTFYLFKNHHTSKDAQSECPFTTQDFGTTSKEHDPGGTGGIWYQITSKGSAQVVAYLHARKSGDLGWWCVDAAGVPAACSQGTLDWGDTDALYFSAIEGPPGKFQSYHAKDLLDTTNAQGTCTPNAL